MTETTENKARELRRVRRMLRELYSLSEHASLAGVFKKEGAHDAIQAYNQLLAFVVAQGVELNGLFSPLPEDASFGRLGVASRLLRSYLEEEEEPEALGKLKDIGIVIREHLPDFLKTPPTPPAPPAPPTPPSRPGGPDGV